MTVGSLFSGIGGFDLGFAWAGFETAWMCEIDPFCQAVLRRHWPDVFIWDDVRTFNAPSRVDVLVGSCPCQPFSSASRGRKRGTADHRWLWPEMRRIVQQARPRVVVSENVAQFDGVALEQMAADLESDGYEVGPALEIPACAVGLDHWRSRIWILGYAHGHGQSVVPIHAETSRMSRRDGDATGVGAAHGLPRRLDGHRRRRLAALGNAIVPQIAYELAIAVRSTLEAAQ